MRVSIGFSELLLCGLSLVTAAQAEWTCKQDNCLNALAKTTDPVRLSSAQAFCATFTTALTTATAAIPAYATSQCAFNVTRVSSACSCVPTPPPTTSHTIPTAVPTSCSTVVAQNGDWEEGSTDHWTVNPYSLEQDPTRDVSYCVSYPGYNGSSFQFIADLTSHTLSEIQLNQVITRCRGINYRISINYKFDFTAPQANTYLDVYIDGGHVIYLPGDGSRGPLGQWAHAEAEFRTTYTSEGSVYIVFTAAFGDSARIFLDDVQIVPIEVDPFYSVIL